ncbi:hypothetical protein S40285_05190 [Stachybotrys chlorohalonatus IBT 40285]|uniref:Protein BIG1 n=1 Tax=Stachybotrys chlorohalonatus (strain IBT 40285) TaxID=1283841 RepID=A0A084QF69_STAC4|nr:hypothetical protein S40285_05190 [Stachybotrys chlorohalonata IBT 40285]
MRLQTLVGALVCAGSSAAFSDSTPFALWSTSTFANTPSQKQIQTSSAVSQFVKNVLAECPTDRYLLVAQPGANAADLRSSSGCALPSLCKAARDPRLRDQYVVSEVIGEVERDGLAAYIELACSEKQKAFTVDEVTLSPLGNDDRASVLTEHDAILAGSLEKTTLGDSYTILYLSTPGEGTTYEAEFAEPLRMELKRNVQQSFARRQSNETDWNRLPLFRKYQFFTPGIFMGLVTAIVILSILYVGLSALASLEVSYGAFEKDMSPMAQKKQ